MTKDDFHGDGAETIAEALVAFDNGINISAEMEQLLAHFIWRYKK